MKKLALLPAILLFCVKTASAQCLAGHYTIGGASPDFATIQSAIDSITKNGWQDTVWFDIRPGLYEEHLVSSISTAGNACFSQTPVFFQKEKGAAGDAILSWPAEAGNGQNNYVLKLDNSTFCVFVGLTFQRTGTPDLSDRQLVEANLGYTNNEAVFKNCRFIGQDIDPSSSLGLEAHQSHIKFSGLLSLDSCRFEGGAFGVWCRLGGRKLVARNNVFEGQAFGAFWLKDGFYDTVEIRKNTIRTGTVPYSLDQPFAAIFMEYGQSPTIIAQNHIESGNFGIKVLFGVVDKITVAHNFVVAPAGSGIWLTGGAYASIVYNSIKAQSGLTLVAADPFYTINGQTGSVVANIFDVASGPVLQLGKLDREKTIFRSNCFVPNANLPLVAETNGAGQWDFSTWKSGDRERYSIQKPVQFVSPTDLHLAAPDEDLNGRGIPFGVYVNEFSDIDGDSLPADGWADVGADQIALPVSNASISHIVSLSQRQRCGEVFPIKIAVKNTGEKPLLSALISWKKNGQPQPDFLWTGNLPVGARDTAVVATLPFLPDSAYQFSFLIKEANGREDLYEGGNDAAFEAFSDLAAGDITVGYNGKFKSISDLSDRLAVVGLCGSARIVLLPGVHQGSLFLTQKLGLSASKTLEITAEDGDREAVTWTGGSFGNDPTLSLQSVSHVWLHDLRMETGLLAGVVAAQNCSHLLFENVEFQHGYETTVYVENTDSSAFRNCLFHNLGQTALWLNKCRHTTVEGCRIEQYQTNSWPVVKLHQSTDCCLEGCRVAGPIDVQSSRRMDFFRNELTSVYQPGANTAPLFSTMASDSMRIANNFFTGKNMEYQPTVSLTEPRWTDFAHNSVLHATTASGILPAALFVELITATGPAERLQVANNILSSFYPNSPAMSFWLGTAQVLSDHNCFYGYEPGLIDLNNGGDPHTLADWQAMSGQDANSVFFHPPFAADTNLRILGSPPELAGKAVFLPNFSEIDLDGDPRPAAAPDIGADQFAGLSTDAQLIFMSEPGCHGLPGFLAKLKNNGPDTLRRADIRWSANDHPQQTFWWKGSLAPGQSTGWLALGDYIEWPGYDGYKIDAQAVAANDPEPLNNQFSSPAFFTKMGGDYTVGGLHADFHTLTDAAKMLNNVGQCANVRLRLRSGIHAPTWDFFTAPFQPDSLVTVVEPEGAGLLDGSVEGLKINQKPTLQLRRLRLKDASMSGTSKDINWENCDFSGTFISEAKSDNMTFSGCRFRDAQVQLNAGSPFGGMANENLRILDCDFGTSAGEPSTDLVNGQSPGNLSIFGALNLEVRDCRFERTARLSIELVAGKLRVEGNTFGCSPGLLVKSCNFLSEDTARVANNFFHFAGLAPYSGPYQAEAAFCTWLNFWHNSFLFSPTNPASDLPYIFSPTASTNLLFENNLVKTTGEARAFYWTDFATNKSENNHFDLGPGGIQNGFPSLGEWSSLSGFDKKSTVGAVKFEAENDPAGLSNDLHLDAAPLIPLTSNVLEKIKTDFDGQPRGATSTVIGADEPLGLPLAGPVWPGDCDGDKQVSSLDWLHLGLAIGQGKTGAARADKSISWSPKFAADWADSVQQVNSKHADCNGDGAATAADTLAISQNFGQAHFALGQADRTGVPLFVDLPAGPYFTGQKIAAPLRLGSAVEKLYGAAVEVEFSPNAIKPGSFWADFSQNWLGADAIGFFEKDNSAQIQLALTRTNGLDATDFGQIGVLHFEVGQLADSLKIRAAGLRGILSNGDVKSIAAAEPPAVGVVVSTKNLTGGPALELWPNPTAGVLFLKTKEESGSLAEVFDGLGRLVFSQKTGGGAARLDLGGLPGGIYQIRLTSEKGAAVRQVLLER